MKPLAISCLSASFIALASCGAPDPGSSNSSISSPPASSSSDSSSAVVSSSSSSSSSSVANGQMSFVLGINVGGSPVTIDGNDFIGDRHAAGGSANRTEDPIADTTDDALYQSERYGSLTYEIPVTNASYQVILYFNEMYNDAAGARLFDASVEGEEVLTNFDLFAEVGHDTAYSITVDNVDVSDESLTVEMTTREDNATLSGIALFSASGEYVEPPPRETGGATDEDTGADCAVTAPSGSNGGSSNKLPDPFTKWDGTQVTTMEDWRCRRRELRVELENRIYGEKAPPPESVGGSISGSGYSVTVQNAGSSISFSGSVDLPSGGSAPYPAVITVGGFGGLDSGILNSEGVANISYDAYEIASEGAGNFTSGLYYQVNPDYRGETGALTAWAWGVSRIIDMIEQDPDSVIDPTRIAITGCSRFGKAAFTIGAFDERIALGIPFEPGTGGPAPLRALPVYGGQTLGSANGEASWFGPNSGSYSASMAVDMHDTVAMYAPRGLFIMDNPHIDHLAYDANLLGAAAGYEVYKAMGADDALWYHANTADGSHCSFRSEHAAPLRAMIQKFLKGDSSPTTGGITRHSNQGNVDVGSWISDWNTTTISQ